MSREEDAYVIERMGKLLAEIAVIVNGVEPHDTSWSYHDLPEKVRALKQAQHPAAAVPEGEAVAVDEWLAESRKAREEMRARLDAVEPAGACPHSFGFGVPPRWFYEWFIAKTVDGERVVLRPLPEEHTYDYTTADGTYFKADTEDDARLIVAALTAQQAQQPAAAVPVEPVAWQYRFATPDGLTWSGWQQISSEAMAREMVDAFGKAGTRAEWRSLKVFEWGGYAGECTDADFADERARQPAALAVPAQNREPTRTGLASQCYDSAQLSTLPKWCRDLLAKAADALSEAQQPAAAVPEVLVRAYFHRFSEVEDDYTIYHTLDGVCEQCIPVLIVRDDALAAALAGEEGVSGG